MNLEFFLKRLAANARTLESFCLDLTDEQALWRQSPKKWSVQQVVYHLAKTEINDFRPRLEKTLRDRSEDWTPLYPAEMRLDQTSDKNRLSEYLENFLAEREKNVSWLKTLENPNWQDAHRHNEKLMLAAGDLLASWLAHDFLHLKQILRLQYDYTNAMSAPFKTDYAGLWTA